MTWELSAALGREPGSECRGRRISLTTQEVSHTTQAASASDLKLSRSILPLVSSQSEREDTQAAHFF